MGNHFLNIVCAILGLVLGPLLYNLALRLAFPELFFNIYSVNNSAYSEIKKLNERIDFLQKDIEEMKTEISKLESSKQDKVE